MKTISFTCSAVPSADKMSCSVAAPGSVADASISRLPSLTKDQCFSGNLTELQIAITEATSLRDLATTSSAWNNFSCGGKIGKRPDPKPFGYETTVINILIEFNTILFIYILTY